MMTSFSAAYPTRRPLGLAMMILGVIPWIGSALGAVLVV
jgi:hypothetical protein